MTYVPWYVVAWRLPWWVLAHVTLFALAIITFWGWGPTRALEVWEKNT